jgi:hypothetical protein
MNAQVSYRSLLLAALGSGLLGCAKASSPAAPPSASESRPAADGSRGPLLAIPPVATDNRNVLVVGRYPTTVTVSASSSYGGWPPHKAVDGDVTTSWYSARDDSAAHGRAPFIQLTFAEPATVHRVTILGNRDPTYLEGYTILSGKLELLTDSGAVLVSEASAGTGNQRDFDFRLPKAISNVKLVRFTSLEDQGKQNAYGDVAVAELQIE